MISINMYHHLSYILVASVIFLPAKHFMRDIHTYLHVDLTSISGGWQLDSHITVNNEIVKFSTMPLKFCEY